MPAPAVGTAHGSRDLAPGCSPLRALMSPGSLGGTDRAGMWYFTHTHTRNTYYTHATYIRTAMYIHFSPLSHQFFRVSLIPIQHNVIHSVLPLPIVLIPSPSVRSCLPSVAFLSKMHNLTLSMRKY